MSANWENGEASKDARVACLEIEWVYLATDLEKHLFTIFDQLLIMFDMHPLYMHILPRNSCKRSTGAKRGTSAFSKGMATHGTSTTNQLLSISWPRMGSPHSAAHLHRSRYIRRSTRAF